MANTKAPRDLKQWQNGTNQQLMLEEYRGLYCYVFKSYDNN